MNLQRSLVAGIIILSSLLILVLASCKTFTKPNAESIMHNIEIAKELYCSETLEAKRLEMLGKVREAGIGGSHFLTPNRSVTSPPTGPLRSNSEIGIANP